MLIAQRWILARLRDQTFFELRALNAAIRDLLDELNGRPMKKLGVGRRALYEQLDRPALRPLPVGEREELKSMTRLVILRGSQRPLTLCVPASAAGGEEALEAHGDGGRRLRGRAVGAQSGGIPAELDAPTAGRQYQEGQDPAVRPRPVAKRVWASLEHERAEVIAEAMLEAEHHDPERVKRWVVLVDGAETQIDLVEAGAAAYGTRSVHTAPTS